MNGVLNINKPQNMTSHDVVAIVRKALNTKKVGHTGTLDPMATGVLPICVGRATKIVDFIQNDKKTYRAEITFGQSTDTEDAWGEVLDEVEFDRSETEIKEAIESFVGEIEQVPPMYSALKVNGKKLYELARKGQVIERKARTRTIYSIEVISISSCKAIFDVTCSKGTYIRTLCVDIGKKLDTLAHMSSLERTHTGAFDIEHSLSIDYVKNNSDLVKHLLPIDQALNFEFKISVSEKAKELIQNGVKIDLMRYVKFDIAVDDYVLVYNNDVFLALAKYNGEKLIVDKLFDIKKV